MFYLLMSCKILWQFHYKKYLTSPLSQKKPVEIYMKLITICDKEIMPEKCLCEND